MIFGEDITKNNILCQTQSIFGLICVTYRAKQADVFANIFYLSSDWITTGLVLIYSQIRSKKGPRMMKTTFFIMFSAKIRKFTFCPGAYVGRGLSRPGLKWAWGLSGPGLKWAGA